MTHIPTARPGDPANPKVHVMPTTQTPDVISHPIHKDRFIIRFPAIGIMTDHMTKGDDVWLVLTPDQIQELGDILSKQIDDIRFVRDAGKPVARNAIPGDDERLTLGRAINRHLIAALSAVDMVGEAGPEAVIPSTDERP